MHPVGAVTVGLQGEPLAELGAMADSAARVRVFSDDGMCVSDAALMRRALEYVKAFDGVIAQHAQEPRLTQGAQMNEGELSGILGLRGWPAWPRRRSSPATACWPRTSGRGCTSATCPPRARSTSSGWAKKRGLDVTAEVTPHHLLLTDDLAATYDPVYKVNPPLRTKADVEAVRERAGRRHHRLRRHRPRAAPDRGQGLRVERGRVRHARAGDRAARWSSTRWSTPAC